MGFLEVLGLNKPSPEPAAGPVSVICKCPKCGTDAMVVFIATKERIQAVESLALAVDTSRGTTDDDSFVAKTLKRRQEMAEKAAGMRPKRLYDTDQRPSPEV